MSKTLANIIVKLLLLILPPPILKISEWADKYRILSRGPSAEPGVWKTSRAEYQREMMDVITDINIEKIIFMTPAQFGKSEILINTICYYIDQDPSSILLVQPTLDVAKDFSKDRLKLAFQDCKKISDKIKTAKTRDSENTTLHKNFPGGSLSLAGANSAASLAGKPIRILIIDDLDRPSGLAGHEGDYIKLAEKRTTTFHNRKTIYASTPTVRGLSRIEEEYNKSDMRKLHLPCPKCKNLQLLKFDNFKWEKNRPETVKYICQNCGYKISHSQKSRMRKKGQWIAERKTKNIVGFWSNELVSPWVSWERIVAEFLDVKDDPEKLRVFVNTVLTETYEERGEAPSWELLFNRREKYERNIIQKGGLLLVAGADVQKNRIEIEFVVYGRDKESWSVDYRIIPGDPGQQEIWKKIALIFEEVFLTVDNKRIPLRRLAIDSGGHWTNETYRFGRNLGSDRVMIVKGRDKLSTILGRPTRLDFMTDGKKISGGVQLWGVGVSKAKSELYAYLRLAPPTKESGDPYPPGYCHFPDYEEDYFMQLTAEELIRTKTKSGYYHYEWKKIHSRNEALDCRVYARAAADSLGIDRFTEVHWKLLEDQLVDYDIFIDRLKRNENIGNQAKQKGRRILSKGLEL